MADYSEAKIQQVWEKGTIVPQYDSNKYRKDSCGAWIQRDQYGYEGTLGWNIDHVFPASKGGKEELENLRPMNWANNRSKGYDFPTYSCAVESNGNENVSTDKELTVNESLKDILSNRYQ